MNQVDSSFSCRICKSCSINDLIKSPCLCKGSLGYVHLTCLERWLNQVSRDSCELCQYQFNATQSRRYSLLQSWCVWIGNSANRTYLCYDLLIALFITALMLAIIFICLMSIGVFVIQEEGPRTIEPLVRGIIMFFLFVLTSSYITTLYLIVQDHIKPWYNWWCSCTDIRLIINPDLVRPCIQNQASTAIVQETLSKEILSLFGSDSCQNIDKTNKDKSRTEIAKPISAITRIE